jgi:hypothetical protein
MVTGGDDMVWTMVRDLAIQHWKFECDEIVEGNGAGAEPASKRAREPSGSLMDIFLTARGAAAGDSRTGTKQLVFGVSKMSSPANFRQRLDGKVERAPP